MKNKNDILKEYRKSFNKPEKYQLLRLEIEVDKRDEQRLTCDILRRINGVLQSLKEEQSCVKETK